jgi:hypothetical protein
MGRCRSTIPEEDDVTGRKLAVPVISLALALMAIPALAGTVRHTDPDDFEIAPDVQRTTKTTFVTTDGHRRLRISASGDVGPRYRLRVFIDSRRGDRADYVMVATVDRLRLRSCAVWRIGDGTIDSRCDADPYRAWWGVRWRDLRPDKRIRWRIVALRGPGFHEVTDVAPDTGWYA